MRHSGTSQQPIDGPMDNTMVDKREQTGLLTKLVPAKFRNSHIYGWLLRGTRVLQLLSAFISLILFSRRMYNAYRLVNSIKTRRGIRGSYGAVEGILGAALLYSLLATILGCIKKNANPGGRILRWIWVLLDILFVIAFIVVAVLTRPNGGSAGPRRCYTVARVVNGQGSDVAGSTASKDDTCNLPWGTFLLAILSTLLHALTASFHEVKDHRARSKDHEKALQRERAEAVAY